MDDFENLKSFVFFIGTERSGSSLIGYLLDAHPNVVCSNETNILKRCAKSTREETFQMIIEMSKKKARKAEGGRIGGGLWVYKVPNQHQGRYQNLKVIGDKKGGGAAQIIHSWRSIERREKNILSLQKKFNLPIKFISVCRNPFDYLGRRAISPKGKRQGLDWLINDMLMRIEMSQQMDNLSSKHEAFEFYRLSNENFISNPEKELESLCKYVGVDSPQDYIRDCCSIVFKKPNKARHLVKWSDAQIERVLTKCSKYDVFKDYTFED